MHTTCANVRMPSQFVCWVDCARLQITKFQKILYWFVQVHEMPVCAALVCEGHGDG